MEIAALPARRKILFNRFTVYDDAEAVLAVLHIGISSQLIGCGSVFPEYVCKKKFYFVDSLGNIETVAFEVVAKSLEQWSVVGVLNPCFWGKALFLKA